MTKVALGTIMPSDTDLGVSSGATDVAASTSDSAPVSAPDTHADPGTAAETTPASPSDAPVDDHAGLLEAVQKVVQPATAKNPEGEAARDKSDPDKTQTSETTPDPLEADPGEQELAALVPKTRKRMERLLAQRNAARTDLDQLKDPAAKWEQFNTYLTQAEMAPEDVNLLLSVGAHLRAGRMREFRDAIMPYVQLANEALGDWLPGDLQAKVDEGELAQETAAEMSRLRYANARLTGQAQASDRNTQEARQQQTSNAVRGAVTVWEEGVKRRDPDYARKAGAVMRISQALIAEHGAPETPDAAIKLAERAYAEANNWAGGFRPATQSTRPVPDSTRVVNGARAEPTSLMEAAMRGLERSRVTRH